ncbi:zinc-binding alcohol dehydrogenase family protein [Sphingomonas sp. BK235]|uniref:zinc-binding alcohol dehydrogenase family protein n=1 Tax=Sphingomonas sp. BK235 TaxID=2512131 RepID=UPI0010EF1CDC|nr:zinc-binding alcohol dehydrogenase family protein [Sphingomonas sp. BK235]TCP33704.1 2-desacetyl-2-hydroxyethyl bacteriochlorophyllide A dehydrogenase [Sphingomonas sp. BK235]
MLTIICDEPLVLRAAERAPPVRRADDLLVRIRRVGLCGTDYHIFAGDQPFLDYPRVMGHELAGEVVEAPAGSAFRVGQLVTINPYLACGACVACRAGKPNCCAAVAVLGVHVDGGLAELIAVPERAAIDAEGLSLDQAAMVEFLAIGAHAVARARLRPGRRALVKGVGPIGLAVALFARLDGAAVTLCDARAPRLERAARDFGFDSLVRADETAQERFAALTDGDFFETVFDATGNLAAMRDGLNQVAHGGSYVLVSVVKGDLTFADPEFHKRETTLLASRNALAADFARVIAAIRDGTIDTAALHTDSVAARDLPARFPELIARADTVLKAIVDFDAR